MIKNVSKLKRLGIYLAKEDHEKLKQFCSKKGISMNFFVKEFIKNAIK